MKDDYKTIYKTIVEAISYSQSKDIPIKSIELKHEMVADQTVAKNITQGITQGFVTNWIKPNLKIEFSGGENG